MTAVGGGAGERAGLDRNDLLARVDLESLLDALCGAAGPRRRWRCPDRDHPDEHPSVTVTVGADGMQRWRCWSGGHHGTAIDAVMAARRVGVGDAVRWLDDHYGDWPTVPRAAPPPTPPPGMPDRAVVAYVQRAERLLWTAAGADQRDWLAGRGLGVDVLRANRVGADPGRRALPRPRGFPGGWPAVVYPALSPGGTVTYFQARYLDPPAGRDRFDSPARRFAANPRAGWLHPVGDVRPGVLVVTEGVGDGLVAAQSGFPTVAVLGSQYPDAQLVDSITATLDRSPRLADAAVVVCFDADPAGFAGADRMCGLLAERAVPHRRITPPDGADLTAWAQSVPDWHRHVTDPTPPARPAAKVDPAPATPAPPTLPTPGLHLGGLG